MHEEYIMRGVVRARLYECAENIHQTNEQPEWKNRFLFHLFYFFFFSSFSFVEILIRISLHWHQHQNGLQHAQSEWIAFINIIIIMILLFWNTRQLQRQQHITIE